MNLCAGTMVQDCSNGPGDRQTDGRTDGQNHDFQDPNSIAASRGKKVAIYDALPLKAARRDAIAKLNLFGGFESELQTNPMMFHLDSP